MKVKAITGIAMSVFSIAVQLGALRCASSAAIRAARGEQPSPGIVTAAGVGSACAIVLALLAFGLVVASWSNESGWARVPALCLSIAALVWSLVLV